MSILARLSPVCALFVACSGGGTLELTLVTPEGPDPLAGVTRARLEISAPAIGRELTVDDAGALDVVGRFDVGSAVGTVSLWAYRRRELVARGETPPMLLRPADDRFSLLVAKVGTLSRLRWRLASPVSRPMVALLPAMGALIVGGGADTGVGSTQVALYDFFEHRIESKGELPTPRRGGVVVTCDSRCALIALGQGPAGLATSMLRFDGRGFASIPDGLDAADRRTGAAVAPLGDGAQLVVGGEAGGQPLTTLLRLDPGDAQRLPTLRRLSARLIEPRVLPALAATRSFVAIVGGQRAGGAAVEIYRIAGARVEPLALPGPVLGGGAAVAALADGGVVILGGRDGSGAPLRDGWIIDKDAKTVQHFPKALAQARSDATLLRMGSHLVVVGGRGAIGLLKQTEILAAGDLTLLRRSAAIGRIGHALIRLSPGSFLAVGGETGEAGEPRRPLDTIAVYQTFLK